MGLAIKKANQTLYPSDNGDGTTAGELRRAANELEKTVVKSAKSGGLAKSHPLVIKAFHLVQSLREKRLGSAMEIAKEALDASDNGDGITADELRRAADKLKSVVKSVKSAGLPKSHPVVIKATKLDKSIREKATKTKVSAAHVV